MPPIFSKDGSNQRQYKGNVYASFVKYLLQVASTSAVFSLSGFHSKLKRKNFQFLVNGGNPIMSKVYTTSCHPDPWKDGEGTALSGC